MVESSPISQIVQLCRQRNLIIPENVIQIYENNRRNRHLLMDCDLFAQQLNIPTGVGKARGNMITYLKKIVGKDNIKIYTKSLLIVGGQKQHGGQNYKYYQINHNGINVILENRYKQEIQALRQIYNDIEDNISVSKQTPITSNIIQKQNIIYIVGCDQNSYIKAGMSTNMQSRLQQYQCICWDVQILRQYEIPTKYKLKETEFAVLAYLETFCLERRSEKFKFQNIDDMLCKTDIFISNYTNSEYTLQINQKQQNLVKQDIKRLLDNTDYVRCFFEYIKSKGLTQIELKDIDQKIEEWKRDLLPSIPVGFKSILQKKFKDSNNVIEYKNPQEEQIDEGILKVEKKLKPRVMFVFIKD